MATQTDTTPAALLHGALESFFETKTTCDVEGTGVFRAGDGLLRRRDAGLGFRQLRGAEDRKALCRCLAAETPAAADRHHPQGMCQDSSADNRAASSAIVITCVSRGKSFSIRKSCTSEWKSAVASARTTTR